VYRMLFVWRLMPWYHIVIAIRHSFTLSNFISPYAAMVLPFLKLMRVFL
jgi:hypothetical protein